METQANEAPWRVIYVAAAVAILTFMALFEKLQVAAAARRAIITTGRAVTLLRASCITDEEREQLLRHASLSLVRAFLVIAGGGALAILGSLLPIVVLDAAGVVRLQDVLTWLAGWEALLSITAAVAVWNLTRRRQ